MKAIENKTKGWYCSIELKNLETINLFSHQ